MKISGHVPFSHPWSEASLKTVADVLVGGTPSTLIPSFWGGEIMWMSSGDVHLKQVYDVPGRITKEGLRWSNAKLVDPPAVAIALAGQGKTRGTAAMTRVLICTNQSVALIKNRSDRLDLEYLFHNLELRYEELRARSAGGGRAGLSKSIIEALPVPLPSSNEQHKIAAILNVIDDTITKSNYLIAKMKRVKQGLLHDLLTRGIDESGYIRRTKTNKFKDSPLGVIPKEWDVMQLREVVPKAEYGISTSLNERQGLPILRMNNLKNGEVDVTDLKYSTAPEAKHMLLRPRDVLFNRTNSMDHVGRTAIWRGQLEQAAFASYLVRLVPDESRILPEYLNLWLNLGETQLAIRRWATPAVHQVNINPTNLRKANVALPRNVGEQVAIVKASDAQDARVRVEEAYRDKLKRLKKGLMEDLLTGKIRIKNC